MKRVLLHALLAASPLLLTPLVFFTLAEGWLGLGGGCKDGVLVIPWLIFSLIFLITAMICIVRKWPLRRWLLRSLLVCGITLLAIVAVSLVASLV